jgi:hypothetical protein
MNISKNDREILNELAKKQFEIANQPVMNERKHAWTASNDLHPERPMILVETVQIKNYMPDRELKCEEKTWRLIERAMKEDIRHAEEIGDDFVMEPVFRIPWEVTTSDFGIDIPVYTSQTVKDSPAYIFEHVIKTPDDIKRLKTRTRKVNRESTLEKKDVLEDVFNGILPIEVSSNGLFSSEDFPPQIGLEFLGITMQLFEFLGMDRMSLWAYDEPDALHELMEFIAQDRIKYIDFMNEEGLYGSNCTNLLGVGGSYGYTEELAAPDINGHFTSKNIWGWTECQEGAIFSPEMFNEFFLPYLAKVVGKYGLANYGCCEPIDDRIEYIKESIPNLRAVSVCGWANYEKMAESLGNKYIYAKKPRPQYISGYLDWDELKKDIREVIQATAKHNCVVQYIFRDICKLVNDDRRVLGEWVTMAKAMLGM